MGLDALGAHSAGFLFRHGLGYDALSYEAMEAALLADDVAVEAKGVPAGPARAKGLACAAKLLHEACGFLSWVWLALAGELRDSVAILWRVPVVLEPRYVSLQYINGS